MARATIGSAAAQPAYPSLGLARFAQVVLVGIAFFTALDMYVVALLIEPIKHELALTDVQVGLGTATAYYVVYGLLCVPMGMLADRLNCIRMLRLAILLWCGGLAVTGFSHGFWLLVCSKALTGVGAAIVYPAAMSLFSDFFAPDRRAMATASYPVGQALGSAGATLIGGLSFSALAAMVARDPQALAGFAPWRIVSLVFAGGGLVLLPALLILREPARQEVGRDAARGGFRELWAYRSFLLPTFLAIMFLCGAQYGINTWTAPALMRLYGQQPGDFAGWLSAIALLAGIVSTLAGGRLIERARRTPGPGAMMRPAIWASLILAPTCCVAMMPTVLWFAVTMALFQFLVGVAMAIPVISINFAIPNELRGLAMGLYVLPVALIGSATTPLIAFVGGALGGGLMIGRAMALVCIPFACAAALSLWFASRARPAARPASSTC